MKQIAVVFLILVAFGCSNSRNPEHNASYRQMKEWTSWQAQHDRNVVAIGDRTAAIIAGDESDVDDVRKDIDAMADYLQGRYEAVRAADITSTPKLAGYRELLMQYFAAHARDIGSDCKTAVDIAQDESLPQSMKHERITRLFSRRANKEEEWLEKFTTEIRKIDRSFNEEAKSTEKSR